MSRMLVPPTTLRVESYFLGVSDFAFESFIRSEWQAQYVIRGLRPIVQEDEVQIGDNLVAMAIYLQLPQIEVIR